MTQQKAQGALSGLRERREGCDRSKRATKTERNIENIVGNANIYNKKKKKVSCFSEVKKLIY